MENLGERLMSKEMTQWSMKSQREKIQSLLPVQQEESDESSVKSD